MMIKANKHKYPIVRMLKWLDVSKSAYYDWAGHEIPPKKLYDFELLKSILYFHKRSRGSYGVPRILDDLHDAGYKVGKHRVGRLMRENGIRSKMMKRFKKTTRQNPFHKASPNILDGNFQASGPNEKWVSDITYVWTGEGWVYLCVILDLFSRQVIGWALDRRMKQDLVLKALHRAISLRKPGPGCIFHSDRGSQYTAKRVRNVLLKNGFIQSMSGTGNCYDNAVAESFFHSLKMEYVHFERFETREDALSGIFEWIEVFYNRIRRHSALGHKSPVQFEELKNVA